MPRPSPAPSASCTTPARRRRPTVAPLRREEIIDAATAIISDEGIQNLSLSEIESRTGMSRGQLTYYFPEKEQILLAVFDRMVEQMRQRGRETGRDRPTKTAAAVQRKMKAITAMVLARPAPDEFVGIQYTFLAQMRHRADFRERLAGLYEEWRTRLTEDFQAIGRRPAKERRAVACIFQAILHGLVMQSEVDPAAFDATTMTTVMNRVMKQLTDVRGARR
jgi:AcrR family transcriptional regulator